MNELKIRKTMMIVEETEREMGRAVAPVLRKVAAIAVVENPFAGRYVEDLSPLIEAGEVLGDLLAKRAVQALGGVGAVRAYGKAAIVGEYGSAGELEHVAAVIHGKMGKPVRSAVGGGESIIPSSKKSGGPGTRIDVPLCQKDNVWSVPELDAMEISLADAPGPNEMVIALVLTSGGRPLARIGGASETKEEREARVRG